MLMKNDSDAFQKREKASEDFAIRQREMEKLKLLKSKIADHQKHLAELEKSMLVIFPSPQSLNTLKIY
jgi:hypothetical protein